MIKSFAKAGGLLIFLLLAACAPSDATIQKAILQTQAAWTPLPSQTAYPTYTPFPSPLPFPLDTPVSSFPATPSLDATQRALAVIHAYPISSYRFIGQIVNPYAPYFLVVVTERSAAVCGSSDQPERCLDDSACGSIYSSPTCFFFVEPQYVHGADPAARFVGSWSGGLGSLDMHSLHFLDAQNVEFQAAGGDAMTMSFATYKLNLQSGVITTEKSTTIVSTPPSPPSAGAIATLLP
jgi:hypothetical protein